MPLDQAAARLDAAIGDAGAVFGRFADDAPVLQPDVADDEAKVVVLHPVLAGPGVVFDMALDHDAAALSGIGLDVVFSRRLVEADTVEAGGPLAGFTVGAPEAGGFHHAEARALLAGALRRQDGRVCGQVAFEGQGLHGQSP